MKINNKGQSAAGAAILITIITALIILYILFLPPDERNALLNDGNNGNQGGFGNPGGQGVPGLSQPVLLLRDVPGTISFQRTNQIDHNIPSFKISTSTNADEIKRVDSLYVTSGSFSTNPRTIEFSIDPFISDDLVLSFNVENSLGRLRIVLNGVEITDSKINEGSSRPISLPRDLLRDKNNITFEVSSPGIAFWSTNKYQLTNILVSGKITDFSQSFSEQHFAVGPEEFSAIERSFLDFDPQCDPSRVGPLEIQLNFQTIFQGVVKCNVPNTIEISKTRINRDDNVLTFSSPLGQINMNNVKVRSRLMRPIETVYYFNLPDELHSMVERRAANIFVTLLFPEDVTEKTGYLTINGQTTTFKHRDLRYILRVSDFTKPGNNAVIIKPAGTTLEVQELIVEAR